MKIDRLSFTGGTFTFEFTVVNPNPIGFTIREIDYDIRLNDRPFIQGTLTDGIQLPAQGASPFDFPVTIEYFDFFESIQDFFRLENIPYTLSGSVAVGPFRIPFKNTGTLSRPELPEVAITSLKISKLSLLGASMALNLSWKNHNEFPVKFNSFEYEIHLGDARVLNGWFDTVHTLEKM